MSSQSHPHSRDSHDHDPARRNTGPGATGGETRPRRPFVPPDIPASPTAVSQADGDA